MPAEVSSSAAPPSKPTTRGSLRHSLGLASKALADVMNKDDKGSKKATSSAKDTSSRRLMATHSKSNSVSPLVGADNKASKADDTTITRRRASLQIRRSSADDQPPPASKADTSASAITPIPRSSTLRPRVSGSSSGLPKYRPRSIILENGLKPSSPARAGVRRPHSSSDDESSPDGKETDPQTLEDKANRPISPLPQRRSTKANITVTVPSVPQKKAKSTTSPTPKKASPARPTKAVKTVLASSATNTAIPRPSSSTSSRTSPHPSTPKSVRNTSTRDKDTPSPSPLRKHTKAGSDSPLGRQPRKLLKQSPNGTRNAIPPVFSADMSHISEGDSEDSTEADDVADMLAPVAALTAPTPAIPRTQAGRRQQRQRLPPRTPTRALLPSRENLSYVSPLPPDKDGSSFLRPTLMGADNKVSRGSILTWEELSHNASVTLGEEEIGTLLSDITAPFRGGATPGSPTPSNMSLQDVPESPCLSAMPSPGGYGSISQVLLPDVTPSPAIYANASHRFDFSPAETPPGDAAAVTLLRLQLASVENTARERLNRLQILEEELHEIKNRRTQETEELSQQIAILEERMLGGLVLREKNEEEQAAYTRSLEEQLTNAQRAGEEAVNSAILETQRNAEEQRLREMVFVRKKCDAMQAAHAATMRWETVRGQAQCELDSVRGNRDVLSHLLEEVADLHRDISLSR